MLFSSWKWNTIIFVLQVLAGLTAYFLTSSAYSTFLATCAVPLVVSAAGIVIVWIIEATDVDIITVLKLEYFACNFSFIGIGSFLATFSFIPAPFVVINLAIAASAVYWAVITAQWVRVGERGNPFFICLLVVLPLGIGTSFGGLALLWRNWHTKKRMAAV